MSEMIEIPIDRKSNSVIVAFRWPHGVQRHGAVRHQSMTHGQCRNSSSEIAESAHSKAPRRSTIQMACPTHPTTEPLGSGAPPTSSCWVAPSIFVQAILPPLPTPRIDPSCYAGSRPAGCDGRAIFRTCYAAKQLHQVLGLDAFEQPHGILDLVAHALVYPASHESVEFLHGVVPGERMGCESG